jgi:putative ABC transport system permease protein
VSGRLFACALRLVPSEWRASVGEDLEEEAARSSRGRGWSAVWLIVHACAIGVRLRLLVRWYGARPLRQQRGDGGWSADGRRAWRTLRRDGWSTATIVLTLALGIGPVTATYAVFDFVVFRPVPGVEAPESLVTLYYQRDAATPSRAGASYAHLEAMRAGSPALAGLAAWRRHEVSFALDRDEAPASREVTAVSHGWFELVGARVSAGRSFTADEYDVAGNAVAVVSARFARTRFGEAAAVGRDVYLNGRPFRIVGVVAAYEGLEPLRRESVWTPFHAPLAAGSSKLASDVFAMVGRLRAGATLAEAQAEVLRATREAGTLTVQGRTYEPVLFAGITDGIGLTRSRLLRIYALLMAACGLLLVLSCMNAANLLLARNIERQGDFVVRSAIGASRGRLLRELALECMGLALLAAVLGLCIGSGLAGLFRGAHVLSYLPALAEVELDGRVVAFCAAAAGATLLIFAVVPAWLASGVDLQEGLRSTLRARPRPQRLRAALVAAQLALSLTLLTGAALMGTTVWKLQSLDLGLDDAGVYTFRLAPVRIGRDDARSAEILRETRARLTSSRGVEAAAVAWSGPFDAYQRVRVRLPQQDPGAAVPEIAQYVSSEYFDAIGLPLRAGRGFTAVEDANDNRTVLPVVVNEAFGRKWFGTPDPTGRMLTATPFRDDIALHIVGVVANARYRELREGFPPMAYLPAGYQLRSATVIVRTSLTRAAAARLVRAIVQEVDPLLPAGELRAVREAAALSFAEERLLARLGGVIAAIAALLAVAGLYAVIAAFVNDRVREFGIRRALGATGAAVARGLVRRFLGIVAVGIATGAVLVVATTRLLAARLYGVAPLDPATLGATAAALMIAAVLAVWLPARRAVRTDPMVAMRAD